MVGIAGLICLDLRLGGVVCRAGSVSRHSAGIQLDDRAHIRIRRVRGSARDQSQQMLIDGPVLVSWSRVVALLSFRRAMPVPFEPRDRRTAYKVVPRT